MHRIEAAERLAARTPEVDGRAHLPLLFPGEASPATIQAAARVAISGRQCSWTRS